MNPIGYLVELICIWVGWVGINHLISRVAPNTTYAIKCAIAAGWGMLFGLIFWKFFSFYFQR